MHPVRKWLTNYDGLKAALDESVELGLVRVVQHPEDPRLELYCYTKECQFTRAWNEVTMIARGLILDTFNKRVVATPFPKFFNAGEPDVVIPQMPFRVYDKVDGSLIILFWYEGKWRTATKGSFSSSQAKWAEAQLVGKQMFMLEEGATYLFEAVYPENKIVIPYEDAELIGLGAYHCDGVEMSRVQFADDCFELDVKVVEERYYPSISVLLETIPAWPYNNAEGVVIVFDDGTRLKVKTDWYCRLHRLVSRITPLAIWEMLRAGDDLETARRELPEEFLIDFDNIVTLLLSSKSVIEGAVLAEVYAVKHLTDKELGLKLHTYPDGIRQFIFPFRNFYTRAGGGELRHRALWNLIRPTNNKLEGYIPSTAMNRVAEELDG